MFALVLLVPLVLLCALLGMCVIEEWLDRSPRYEAAFIPNGRGHTPQGNPDSQA